MTDKVHASFGRTYRSRERTAATAYGGATGDGYVWPITSRLVEDSEGDLAAGSLGAFSESHSGTSYDVTIDTGEAVVRGSYLARDVQTTLTLPASTAGITIQLGWRDGSADTILLGTDDGTGVGDAFDPEDPRIPIWTFDTDGSGVTGATDERILGLALGVGLSDITIATDGNVTGTLSEQGNRVATRAWTTGGNVALADLGTAPHSALDDAPASAHHTRPDALTDLSNRDHGNLQNVGSSDHHIRYADSEARSAVESGDVAQVTFDDSGRIRTDSDGNGGPQFEFRDLANGRRAEVVMRRVYLSANGLWFTGQHGDLVGLSSNDHHTRYADSEARSAVEAGNLSRVEGANSNRIDFGNSSYVEVTDHNGNRKRIVVAEIYLNNGIGWFTGSHDELSNVSSSDHHTRPTETQIETFPGNYVTPNATSESGGFTDGNWRDDNTSSYSDVSSGDSAVCEPVNTDYLDGFELYEYSTNQGGDVRFDLIRDGSTIESKTITVNTIRGYSEYTFSEAGTSMEIHPQEAVDMIEVDVHEPETMAHKHQI